MASSHGASYSGGFARKRSYDISTTNIAMLGTDLEKEIRKAAAGGEAAWRDCGKKPGLTVWRIEKFKVVAWPEKQYGYFYGGDSYIVLHSWRKAGVGALEHAIHFWIGHESSQDEYGTAAYKTVELDDFLGGAATQYREVQGAESRPFKKLFKQIVVMEGGVDSGFNHVKPTTYRPRLLHVKGKLNVMVREVPVAVASFNSGDSFIFDAGFRVFVWHGKEAGAMEKTKAASVAQSIDDQRGGKVERKVYEEEAGQDAEMWTAMGIKKGPITSAAEGGSDEAVAIGDKRLLRLNDQHGLKLIAEGDAIRRDMLDSHDVFILDDGYEVMIWVGLKASKEERRTALNYGVQYLKDFDRPLDTPISRYLEGGSNEQFEQAFTVGVKSGKDGSAHVGRTGAVGASMMADYKGSGGPGVATDFDALYAQEGVDPGAWGGRTKPESAYAASLGPSKFGSISRGPAEIQRHTREASLKATSSFDPSGDAKALRKAMKGFGTTDQTLVDILCARTSSERQRIRDTYNAEIKRDLKDDVCNDTSGNFRRLLKALVLSPAERGAEFVKKAVQGLGTDNSLLMEVIFTKESGQLQAMVEQYSKMFSADLAKDVHGDTSGDFRDLLNAVLRCSRPASTAAEPDPRRSEDDAKALYKAGEKRMGTNDSKFIEIFSSRSFTELRGIAQAYEKLSKNDLLTAVKSETSGNFRDGLVTILEFALNPTDYWTTRIYKAMKGLGTDDRSLINGIIERAELDLETIKERFKELTKGKSLRDWIVGDTSGYYRKGLLKLIGEP